MAFLGVSVGVKAQYTKSSTLKNSCAVIQLTEKLIQKHFILTIQLTVSSFCLMVYFFSLLSEIEQNVDVDEDNRFSESSNSKNEENPRPSPSLHPSPTQASVGLNIGTIWSFI